MGTSLCSLLARGGFESLFWGLFVSFHISASSNCFVSWGWVFGFSKRGTSAVRMVFLEEELMRTGGYRYKLTPNCSFYRSVFAPGRAERQDDSGRYLWLRYIPPTLLLGGSFASPRGSVLRGTQKIQQKGDLHILFAGSGGRLLCPELSLAGFPCPAEVTGVSRGGGMQSCGTFRHTGVFSSTG